MIRNYPKILVTGSSAVLGTAVKAVSRGHSENTFIFTSSKDGDLTDPTETQALFAHHRPDAVLHLAAVSGGIGLSMKYPATLLRDNIRMTFNVLEAARENKVKKTVMTLTTGMYPPDAPLPLDEKDIHNGYPHDSNYGSSFAKRMVDPAIRSYREEYGMNVIGLIPSGIFGENDNFNYKDAPMLPALIRRFYENRTNTRPIVIWGDGSPLREYSYSKDLAEIFIWALQHYDEAQVLNVGTAEENTVRDIAYMIADIMQIDGARIQFDRSKPNGVFRKSTNNSRFIKKSGFKYTPFRDGLQKTIKWFVEKYESDPSNIRMEAKATV